MGFPILVRWRLYIESGPCSQNLPVRHFPHIQWYNSETFFIMYRSSGMGTFLRWWPLSHMCDGHHRGCLNNSIFWNLGLCCMLSTFHVSSPLCLIVQSRQNGLNTAITKIFVQYRKQYRRRSFNFRCTDMSRSSHNFRLVVKLEKIFWKQLYIYCVSACSYFSETFVIHWENAIFTVPSHNYHRFTESFCFYAYTESVHI